MTNMRISKRNTRRRPINWFRLTRSLHRDIGYCCIGMTCVFAVSGIAVNHLDDWNANYVVTVERFILSPQTWQQHNDQLLAEQIRHQVTTNADIKATHWESPNHFKVFLTDVRGC